MVTRVVAGCDQAHSPTPLFQSQFVFEFLEVATADRYPGAAWGNDLGQLVFQQLDLEDGAGRDQILAVTA